MRNYGNGSLLGVSNQPDINKGYGIWDFNTIARALLDSKWGVTTGISKLGTEATAVRTTSGSTITATHNLLSGSNRVSWCIAMTESVNAISSATFGGVAATALTEKKHSGSSVRIRMFYVLNASLPATGNQNWVVTFAGNVTYAVMGCGTIEGAYQGAPEATASGEGSSSGTVSFSITTLTNKAWIISGAGSVSSGTELWTSYGTGQTQLHNTHCGASSQVVQAATYEEKATAGADTQSFNRNSINYLVAFGAAFKPA